jgi:hypothetical protein
VLGIAVRERLACLLEQDLEAVQVELAVRDVQQVAGCAGDEQRVAAAVRAEGLA